MIEVAGTTGAVRRTKLRSNRHHRQTDIELFTGPMPFLSHNQQHQSTEGKGLCKNYSTESGRKLGSGTRKKRLYLVVIRITLLHCAAYCNRPCLFVGLFPRQLEIACIDLHQTGSVGEGTEHLQLIKFWPFCAPGKGSVAGRKVMAPPYYSQHTVFGSL